MIKNPFLIILAIIVLMKFHAFGQTTWQGSKNKNHNFTLSGFGDLYYGKHVGNYAKKESFYYNHKVNDKIRTNLLLLKGEFTSPRFHATLGLMTGDYSQFNLSAEPNWAKPLNEAYVGIKLSKKKNLWWDAGVYSSYIGIESSISSDCPTLTRSIVAENSPYYLSGTRLLYTSDNDKNEFGFHVLNGWQRIGWDPLITRPSFGAHYKRNLNDHASLMYGVFYGSIYPDSLSINRFYQHANVAWKKNKWEMWATLDLGLESGFIWGSTQLIANYAFDSHWSVTQRLEVYYDPNNRCARIGALKETTIGAYAVCTNYALNKNILIRFEPKFLLATEPILKSNPWDLQFNIGIGMKF